MYIHEAVKEAIEKDMCITWLTKDKKLWFKLKPAGRDGMSLTVAYPNFKERKMEFEKWIPTSYELQNNDWILVDNDLSVFEEQIKKEWWK